jgi:hypothetical protein
MLKRQGMRECEKAALARARLFDARNRTRPAQVAARNVALRPAPYKPSFCIAMPSHSAAWTSAGWASIGGRRGANLLDHLAQRAPAIKGCSVLIPPGVGIPNDKEKLECSS